MKDKGRFSNDEIKILAQKINEAAEIIGKSKNAPANYISISLKTATSFGLIVEHRIMRVKQWLIEKNRKEGKYDLYPYHSIDAEAELTRILTEEIGKEIKKEHEKQRNAKIDS